MVAVREVGGVWAHTLEAGVGADSLLHGGGVAKGSRYRVSGWHLIGYAQVIVIVTRHRDGECGRSGRTCLDVAHVVMWGHVSDQCDSGSGVPLSGTHLDVAEDVTLGVLCLGIAPVQAKSVVGRGRLPAGELVHGEASVRHAIGRRPVVEQKHMSNTGSTVTYQRLTRPYLQPQVGHVLLT